jgi:phage tail-like protein
MPVSVANPVIRTDPVPGYSYAIFLREIIVGWFTECGGLTMERAVKEYPEGGVNDHVHQLPGHVTRARITLKHGLAGDKLWQWFQQGAIDGQVDRHHISIVLYDGTFVPAAWWNLFNAFPVRWVGPGLKSHANEALIEEVEFAYAGSYGAGSGSILQRAGQDPPAGKQLEAGGQPVNLPALADKVYKLLKDDLRVTQERQGHKRR